ncbi:MAG: tetratricopeptide repeat protein, partial [Planctomycetes bacterium]|nr:tetratricopeptide repeat protein [Planctomycetota bacterium]
VRLAELALWDGNYALALLNYQVLVDGDIMQRSYWKGYLSAAVGMSNLSREQKATVLAIENEAGRQKYSDAAFKALLASVMQNMGEKEKAMTLLTEALKLDPTRRSSRMQLADLLSDMGDFEEADRHYQMLLD